MNLQSPKTIVDRSQKNIFDFLSDLNNFKKLMPDSLETFDSDTDSFSFKLKGMPKIHLKIKERKPNGMILLDANGGKIEFELQCIIKELSTQQSEIQFFFEGSFNPLLKMMVKEPLQNFINILSKKTVEI
jgi:carbon monoxide dehydrogenase subunit G